MNGFVYVATGEGYLREAFASATSLRAAMPEARICLVCDRAPDSPHPFDDVVVRDDAWYGPIDKRLAIEAPYDRIAFLDTDTLVVSDVTELFTLLDRFDMAALPETKRGWHYALDDAPRAFAEFNTGVLVFRKDVRTRAFFAEWTRRYGELNQASDQPAFRDALWASELRVAPLPSEFHFLANVPNYVMWDAKIIHARGDLARIARDVNAVMGPRTYLPDVGVMQAFHGKRGWLKQMGRTLGRMSALVVGSPTRATELNPGKWWKTGRSNGQGSDT